MSTIQTQPQPDAAGVLSRAVLRAAQRLGVRQTELAGVLGISEPTASRLAHGDRTIEPTSKEGELALLFLRAFRSLDALFGGHAEPCRAWFDAPNDHLGGIPRDMITSVQGLVAVTDYLDAIRAKV